MISLHRHNNIEVECRQCFETFNTTVRQAAEEFNIPLVSIFNAFNGINHNEDPREKGYIGEDGRHASELGRQVIADLISAAGYEPVTRKKE
jgi:lysophospholipase L1-like esterase